jgi:hypothetical protein
MAKPTPDFGALSYTKFCSRLSTCKVTGGGYIYTKRCDYKGTEYWKCDLRNVCNAGIVFKNGSWIKTKGWESGEHKSHLPDFDRYSIK